MSLGVSIPIFCGSWTVRTYEDHPFVTIVPAEGGADVTIYCVSSGHAHKMGNLIAECGPNVARDHIPTRVVEPPPAPVLPTGSDYLERIAREDKGAEAVDEVVELSNVDLSNMATETAHRAIPERTILTDDDVPF